jgi:hypothetical protein
MGEENEPIAPDSHPPMVQWVVPGEAGGADEEKRRRRGRIVRIALISAVLWVLLGLGLAFVSARLGYPTLSGYLAVLSGLLAVLIVGRRLGLKGSGDWIRAILLTVGIMWLVVGFASCAAAILIYG